MSHSLEDNPRVLKEIAKAQKLAQQAGFTLYATVLQMAHDALKHTHSIAVAGWLDTEEHSNDAV